MTIYSLLDDSPLSSSRPIYLEGPCLPHLLAYAEKLTKGAAQSTDWTNLIACLGVRRLRTRILYGSPFVVYIENMYQNLNQLLK